MIRAMNRVIARVAPERNLTSSDKRDAMDELAKLKELFDMGAITEEEFNEKKKSIMKRI